MRAIGEPAHRNNQSEIRALFLERGVAVRQGLRFLRAASHPCHADHVLSLRIVRIIEGLADDWRRLDERIDHLSDERSHGFARPGLVPEHGAARLPA